MQIWNEIIQFQIKQPIKSHGRTDIQVRFSNVKQKKEQNVALPNETELSQMNQAGNIKGAYTMVQRNIEIYKLPAVVYYRFRLVSPR